MADNRMFVTPDLETFDQIRSNLSLSDEQFARAVLNLPLFQGKRILAGKVLARQWPLDRLNDAMQEAAISVYFYLVATRGCTFQGTSDDQLGTWFYSLLHQHAVWALFKDARGEQRRRKRELTSSRREEDKNLSSYQFTSIVEKVLAMIEDLPEPHRTIGLDLHFGIPAKDTAKACDLSDRRVYELRKVVLSLVLDSLQDLI